MRHLLRGFPEELDGSDRILVVLSSNAGFHSADPVDDLVLV